MDPRSDVDDRKRRLSDNENGELKRPIDMTMPERIVLSAGYDGDDNEEDAVHHQVPDLFGDQPLQPPDVLMHGMSTPPSTLTIDDSEATYARSSRAQAGDGSASSHPQFQTLAMLEEQYQDDSDVESRFGNIARLERENERLALVGKEDDHMIINPQLSLNQLQRRVRMLENELIENEKAQSMWKFFLLALTFINPLLMSYFMRRR